MEKSEIKEALIPLLKAFKELGILYYVGGSVASSIYGIARATMDIDMVCDLKEQHVNFLSQILKNIYFADENMILDAIRTNSTFNLIHFETGLKIDVFILKEKGYYYTAFERRRKDTITDEPEAMQVYLCSAEDSVLTKLEWYRLSDHISERQWKDVIGILKVQGDKLDKEYLFKWSEELKISDLLEKALLEAGIKKQL
jgi:hypothetical protein